MPSPRKALFGVAGIVTKDQPVDQERLLNSLHILRLHLEYNRLPAPPLWDLEQHEFAKDRASEPGLFHRSLPEPNHFRNGPGTGYRALGLERRTARARK